MPPVSSGAAVVEPRDAAHGSRQVEHGEIVRERVGVVAGVDAHADDVDARRARAAQAELAGDDVERALARAHGAFGRDAVSRGHDLARRDDHGAAGLTRERVADRGVDQRRRERPRPRGGLLTADDGARSRGEQRDNEATQK